MLTPVSHNQERLILDVCGWPGVRSGSLDQITLTLVWTCGCDPGQRLTEQLSLQSERGERNKAELGINQWCNVARVWRQHLPALWDGAERTEQLHSSFPVSMPTARALHTGSMLSLAQFPVTIVGERAHTHSHTLYSSPQWERQGAEGLRAEPAELSTPTHAQQRWVLRPDDIPNSLWNVGFSAGMVRNDAAGGGEGACALLGDSTTRSFNLTARRISSISSWMAQTRWAYFLDRCRSGSWQEREGSIIYAPLYGGKSGWQQV